MHIQVQERSDSDNPDGTLNYKMLNGYVFDDNGNNIGIIHIQVKADVEVPDRGYYDLAFKANDRLKKSLTSEAAAATAGAPS